MKTLTKKQHISKTIFYGCLTLLMWWSLEYTWTIDNIIIIILGLYFLTQFIFHGIKWSGINEN